MTGLKTFFAPWGRGLVKLGRALMLPIAVLPIAGLLLRCGMADVLNIPFMEAAGMAVFANLSVIFAVGVAIGFAEENHGAAALAAFVGYIILTSALAVLDDKINMGVLGGIIVGVTAGLLYNKYKSIKLPSYLGFFGGRRFVPIVTGAACLVIAVLAYFIWPPIGKLITNFGDWTIKSGNIGLFFYGIANRLLLPFGLHHIINNLVWYQFGDFTTIQKGVELVVNGDMTRFFAKDPSAGIFMAGFFPIMMFGLPAACLAMIRTANTVRRKATAGLLLSMALTSFLTGITEPIEFSFMFLAPALYGLHAILTGLSMVVMNVLEVKLGFTFSAGMFDYVLSYGLGHNGWYLIPIGVAYGLVYYLLFTWVITKFNLPTPGREPEEFDQEAAPEAPKPREVPLSLADRSVPASEEFRTAEKVASDIPLETPVSGAKYLEGLGGKENIKRLDACATRLRVEVKSETLVNNNLLKQAGARGVVRGAGGSIQVVIGPEADLLADDIRKLLK